MFKEEIEMVKIFISGSRSITYCTEVATIIKTIKNNGNEVLVGDCYGLDSLVRKECIKQQVPCTVYYIGKRRDSDPLPGKQIPGSFFSDKDKAMARDCDKAVAIWDGRSNGTRNNVETMRKLNKTIIVINNNTNEIKII